MVDWFVSVWEESADLHHYRGGQSADRVTAIEQVVAAGREIACRVDGSIVDGVGQVVVDGIPVDAVPFGDVGVGDECLRHIITTALDRLHARTEIGKGVRTEEKSGSESAD